MFFLPKLDIVRFTFQKNLEKCLEHKLLFEFTLSTSSKTT